MKRFIYILTILITLLPAFSSCKEGTEPIPSKVKDSRMAVLVYAVAANSLAGDLTLDKIEMVSGAREVDLDRYDWLVYSVLPSSSGEGPTLQRLVKSSSGEPVFETLKTYDPTVLSTDPERMRAVLADFRTFCHADNYGLVLWSHATGWETGGSRHDQVYALRAPADETEVTSSWPAEDTPVAYAFGEDNSQGTHDSMDIDELALAIPDRFFTFIWFDCCYMSNIETLYQMRNKCDRYIAYAMEIGAKGLPYDVVMPCLLRENPDYVKAARETFNWYNDDNGAVTVTVSDTGYLPALAEASKKAYLGYDGVSTSGLQNYSRRSQKYYDFRQYTARVAEGYGNEAALAEVDEILAKMILYADISDYDFNHRPLDKELFSGVSCHAVKLPGTPAEDYYRTLDWYKAAYTPITDR